MKYLLYQITNLKNNKIYIGAHSTENINDSYMGSGILIEKAIKHRGKSCFKKEILCQFKNEHEMYLKEAEIVNEDFILREDTYNLALGGNGGRTLVKGTQAWNKWYAKILKNIPMRKDKNSKEYKDWFEKMQASLPRNKPKDSVEYKEWYEYHLNYLSSRKDKNSEEYKLYYGALLESLPCRMDKNSPKYQEWYANNPSFMNKDTDEYKEWFKKQQLNNHGIKNKDSEEYVKWLKRHAEKAPSCQDKNSPEYIEWRKKFDKSVAKRKGWVAIKNIKLNKNKRVAPKELDEYLSNGWDRGLIHYKN